MADREKTRAQRTRQQIFDAACERFAEVGYEATTIRSVAKTAGVDPALVIRYFGSKQGLFDEVATGIDIVGSALFQASDARELVRTYLEMWQDDQHGPRLRALLRAGLGSAHASDRLRQFIFAKFEGLEAQPHFSKERFPFAGAALLGIASGYFLVGSALLERYTIDEVVDIVAPGIEKILDMD